MYIYSPTAHTTGPIMTKPGMMMVPHLGMLHTIFQGKGQRSRLIAYVYILSYSPHHWTDHDQTWHDDGPRPRDGAHHFSRSGSKVKVIFGAALHKLPHLGMVHAKLGFATILGAATMTPANFFVNLN